MSKHKKPPYVPISKRWKSPKFRMWRLADGYWAAVQPLRIGEPMFARSGYLVGTGPSHQFVDRDPKAVLHELQLAMAKAAA